MKNNFSGSEKIRLKKGEEKEILKGFPWVFAGQLVETSGLLAIENGSLVELVSSRDEYIATAYYNSKSKICCRVLSKNKNEKIDQEFFARHILKALEKRQKFFLENYYRAFHSESDGIPGLVIDRFGKILVLQIATLGLEKLESEILAASKKIFSPETIVLRNDIPSRKLEGLKEEIRVVKGELGKNILLKENNIEYFADLLQGQKTGWFYDQRENRRIMADYATDKTVADIFCHSGGFGLLAAKHGAKNVVMVDASEFALELAKKSAAHNNLSEKCEFICADAFLAMQNLSDMGKKFAVVITDPPAFVKSKKDIASGMKGYEKVARLAAKITAGKGILYIASCSHHAGKGAFIKAVEAGIKKAGRKAKLIKTTASAEDHPIHPQLPQTGYLKSAIFELD